MPLRNSLQNDRVDDYQDALQMTFLTDMELAQVMQTSVKHVQYLRKKKVTPTQKLDFHNNNTYFCCRISTLQVW